MTLKQKRANKETETETKHERKFDLFIETTQTHVAFGWLGRRSGEKT